MPHNAPKTAVDAHTAHCACKEALEADVRALKRQLAARAIKAPAAVVKRDAGDPFAHLAPQDRKFMRKRLGLKDG